MKDYLNQSETNDFMCIGYLLDTAGSILGIERSSKNPMSIEKVRAGWADRGNLTKEEHKSLKMAETYLSKFYTSVLARMSRNEAAKVYKRLTRYTVKFMDEFTLNLLNVQLGREFEVVKIEREQYQQWCEEIMNVNCKNCTKHHDECKLCSLFENTLIPESQWNLDNCRYAYAEIVKG